jgi:hypothetical protein
MENSEPSIGSHRVNWAASGGAPSKTIFAHWVDWRVSIAGAARVRRAMMAKRIVGVKAFIVDLGAGRETNCRRD